MNHTQNMAEREFLKVTNKSVQTELLANFFCSVSLSPVISEMILCGIGSYTLHHYTQPSFFHFITGVN